MSSPTAARRFDTSRVRLTLDAGRRGVALICGGVLAAILAGAANAAVFVQPLRTGARVGELMGAEVDAWTATHHPPLYLAPEQSSTAFTTTRGAPRGTPYVRLRRIEWRPVRRGRARIRFRVPTVKRGRYRLIVYCEPCTGGPTGSLIGSVNTNRLSRPLEIPRRIISYAPTTPEPGMPARPGDWSIARQE
jgi:hypothetical protein